MDDMVSAIQDLTFDAPDYRSVFNQMLSQLESINGYMPTFNSRLTNIHDYLSSINNRQNTYFPTWNSRFTNMHDYLYSIRDTNISISNDIANLSLMYADDDMIEAKEASQEVIQDTLDNFTGSGAGAAKKSQTSGAKDISAGLQSGLDAGGSTGDALDVFSPANAFWGWFSTDNANYFSVSYPSHLSNDDLIDPAPRLRSIQKLPDYYYYSWSDDVPDVLSSLDSEYESHLGDN